MSMLRTLPVVGKAVFSPVSRKSALNAYKGIIQASNYATRAGFRRVKVDTTAKQSLKERLMGPTTGRPFAIGQMGLGIGAAAGVAGLCVYGLGFGSDVGAIDKYGLWPQYVRERLHSTYAYLGGSLGVTAAAGMAASRNPTILRMASANSMLAIFGSIALIIAAGTAVRSIPYESTGAKHAAWLAHASLMGAFLAPLCVLGGPLLIRAAWMTAGMVGGLSAVAVCAPSEKFLQWSGPLAMGFGVVLVATIGSNFLPPTTALGAGMMSIAVYGGLLLFGAMLLMDTQRAIKTAEALPPNVTFDPVNAQIRIYMDILNIFVRLATILGMNGNRRK